MPEKQYFVYILTNYQNTVLYTGVTNNLQRRVWNTAKANRIASAPGINSQNWYIMRSERMPAAPFFVKSSIKAGSRQKKMDLIHEMNPQWKDLFDELFA